MVRRRSIRVVVTCVTCVTCVAVLATVDPQAQDEQGPYARIAMFHPRDGQTTDFEAGYMRHLAWHQQARDSWRWFGWTVTFGERQRWFIYASFGHPAESFDHMVAPADDERDNVLNVAPHVDQWSNAVYEYLPAASRPSSAGGHGEPQQTPRVELTIVELHAGTGAAFEAALAAASTALRAETLWYRMVAGGSSPRYVRLRPRADLASIFTSTREQQLPESVQPLVARTTIDVLTLRPTMSLGLGVTPHD